MIEFLFLDANSPYLFALGFVLLIGLFEGLALMLGASLSGLLDDISPFSLDSSDIDASAIGTGGVSSIIGWLCLDKVPLLIWLVLFLTSFSILGYTLNYLSIILVSSTLPNALAPVISLFASVFVTAKLGTKISRAVPQIETSAIDERVFMGQQATILSPLVTYGSAGEASFIDEHQQKHYVMVEPIDIDQAFRAGQQVILVEKTLNSWKVIPFEPVA